MTATETITNEVEVIHATITYKDGETESVEYIERWTDGDFVEFVDITDEGWVANYNSVTEGSVVLHASSEANSYIVHTDEIKTIEPYWTEELVAVAEVEIIEEGENRLLWPDNTSYRVEPEEPDVTLWEKAEWEAMQDNE